MRRGRIAATIAENLSPAAPVEGHAQNPHTAIKIEALSIRRALCAYVGNATKRYSPFGQVLPMLALGIQTKNKYQTKNKHQTKNKQQTNIKQKVPKT
jgi:hypothetical protein